MTHLPHVNRNVWGVPGAEPELEEVCAHPRCNVTGRENLERHELWPKSFLRSQPYRWVRLPDGQTVCNQVYLCNSFHNGHHQTITENKARIEWDGVYFWWVDEEVNARLSPYGDISGVSGGQENPRSALEGLTTPSEVREAESLPPVEDPVV